MSNSVIIRPDENGVPALIGLGNSSSLNISTPTVVKNTVGRIGRVSVITAGSTAGTVNDSASTAGAVAANQIASIPNVVGVTAIDFPCFKGITIVPGTGQVLSVSYM